MVTRKMQTTNTALLGLRNRSFAILNEVLDKFEMTMFDTREQDSVPFFVFDVGVNKPRLDQ